VEGWTEHSYKWLDKLQLRRAMIPFGMMAWEVLKHDFKNAFINYAEHNHAADKLKKLQMKEGCID
jgi:hypothetical protein